MQNLLLLGKIQFSYIKTRLRRTQSPWTTKYLRRSFTNTNSMPQGPCYYTAKRYRLKFVATAGVKRPYKILALSTRGPNFSTKFVHNGHAQSDVRDFSHTHGSEKWPPAREPKRKTHTDGHLKLYPADDMMWHGFPIKLKQKGTVFEDFKWKIWLSDIV